MAKLQGLKKITSFRFCPQNWHFKRILENAVS